VHIQIYLLMVSEHLVHRRIQKIQLIGFASTFTKWPDRSVCVDAL